MTWILIANATLATFYREHVDGSLEWMHQIEHPEGRLHAHGLVSDRPGRSNKGPGGAHVVFEARTDPVDVEMDHFIARIVPVLADAVRSGGCLRLVLVAPPRMLGRLRPRLPDAVARCVAESHAMDLGRRSIHKLPAALFALRVARAARHPEGVPTPHAPVPYAPPSGPS